MLLTSSCCVSLCHTHDTLNRLYFRLNKDSDKTGITDNLWPLAVLHWFIRGYKCVNNFNRQTL